MHEWLRRLFIPSRAPRTEGRHIDLERVDERLTRLEHEQDEIEVRIDLLERQADPRGIVRGTFRD